MHKKLPHYLMLLKQLAKPSFFKINLETDGIK
jgi:hypothetical protein